MLRWRVVYTDGSSFSSEDGSPAEAPGGGVIAVVQEDATVGAFVFSGRDFYVFDEAKFGGWMFMDYFGLAQYLVGAREAVVLKLGDSMDTARYRKLLEEAKKHGLEKSARHTWERSMP